MTYRGALFGKLAGKYVSLDMHSDDVDVKDARITELEAELAAEREKVEMWKSLGKALRDHMNYDDWPCECDDWDQAIADASTISKTETVYIGD